MQHSKSLYVVLLAAGLAGCAGSTVPPQSRSARDASLPPGEGALGDALSWERKAAPSGPTAPPAVAAPAAPAAASTAEQEEFRKWKEQAGRSERQEFEEWRAWQEWKRKNPK